MSTPAHYLLPLMTASVRAGFPSPAEDHIEAMLDLNQLLIKHPAATFFVRVKGSSMVDANIISGDIVIVDRSLNARAGSIVVAIIDGDFTIKRLVKRGKQTMLVAEQEQHPPIIMAEGMECEIWGVVTTIIHRC